MGQYRRVQKGAGEVQDASFFDPTNEVRQKSCPERPTIPVQYCQRFHILHRAHLISYGCIVQAGLKARHHALMAALEDMDTWLEEGGFLTGEYRID